MGPNEKGGEPASGPGPLGPREASAMEIFWRDPAQFLSVRQVKGALDAELAYTTVMTLLTRLHRKGYLERRLAGRAWTYRPVMSRSEHAATTMRAALRDSDDHTDVLLRFVEQLTPAEQRALRRRLEEDDRP